MYCVNINYFSNSMIVHNTNNVYVLLYQLVYVLCQCVLIINNINIVYIITSTIMYCVLLVCLHIISLV